MSKRFWLISLTIWATTGSACGQATGLGPQPWGSWLVATAQLPGGGGQRWGGFAEGQLRANAVARQLFSHEIKAGLSSDLNGTTTALLGGGRYTTYDYQNLEAGPTVAENRVWQQLALTHYASRLKLEHRFRWEQRWLALAPDNGPETSVFRQRLRYRLNALLPLGGPVLQPGGAFVSAYNEVFLNPSPVAFERNRFYLGAGYQFSAALTGQLGWLMQADFNQRFGPAAPGTVVKNSLVLAWSWRIRRGKPGEMPAERLPTQLD